jgi:signal peptidase I
MAEVPEDEEIASVVDGEPRPSDEGEAELESIEVAGTVPYEEESRWESTKANAKTIGGALFLALFIRIVLFEAFQIEGPSMEPTLLDGDRVVVAKFLYGLFPLASSRFPLLGGIPLLGGDEALVNWGMPEAGDVVIVHSPYDNQDIVKRVIGVGGDRISIRRSEVFRNGESIRVRELGDCEQGMTTESDLEDCVWYEERIGERSWRTSQSRFAVPDDEAELVVPEGHIYVLGDHRDHSNDSRNPRLGPVPAERVKGRVLSIYWSNGPGQNWYDFSGIRSDRLFQGVR